MQIKKFLFNFWLLLALCFSFEVKSASAIKSYLAKRRAIAQERAKKIIKPLKIAKNAIIFCALDSYARPHGYTMEIILDSSGNRLSQSNSIYEVLQKLAQAKNYYIEGIFIGEQGAEKRGAKEILNSVHTVVAPDLLSRKKRIFSSIGQMAIKHSTTQCIYFYSDDVYKIPENILKSPNLVQVKILQRPVVSPSVSRPTEVVPQPIIFESLRHVITAPGRPDAAIVEPESGSSDETPDVAVMPALDAHAVRFLSRYGAHEPATVTKPLAAPAVAPETVLAKGSKRVKRVVVNPNPSVGYFNKHQNPDQVGRDALARAYARGDRPRLPQRIDDKDQSVKSTIAQLKESVSKSFAEIKSTKTVVRGASPKKIYALGQGTNQCSLFALAHALLDDVLVTSEIQDIDTARGILDKCFNSFEKYLSSDQSVTRSGRKITAADYLRLGGIDILEFNKFLAKSGLLNDKAIMPAMTEEMLTFILNEFFVGPKFMTNEYVPLTYETALDKMRTGFVEVVNTTPGRSGDAVFEFAFHANDSRANGKVVQRFDDVLKQHFFSTAIPAEQKALINSVRLSLDRWFNTKKLVAIVYSQSRQHFYEVSVDMNRNSWHVARDSIHHTENAFMREAEPLNQALSRLFHSFYSYPATSPTSTHSFVRHR